MNNKTAIDQCGEENSCSGTSSNFICICNGYGYKLDDHNNQTCTESKSFLLCPISLFYLKPFDPSTNVAERSGSNLIFTSLYSNSKIAFDIVNSVFEIICRPIKDLLVPGA